MGIYDRGYYDGDDWRSPGTSPGNRAFNSVIKSLVIINVVIFLLDMFSGVVQGSQTAEGDHELRLSTFLALKQGMGDLGYSGPLDSLLYFWQFLSYGFAHASITSKSGIFHILFNMFFLVMLGRSVEQRLGNAEFLRFYLLAIVVSGIAWFMVSYAAGRPGRVVGASGAVTAVVFLFVFFDPKQTLMIFGVIPAPAWILGVLFLVSDVSMAFSRESTVAAETHLAGAGFAAVYHYRKWRLDWMQIKGASKWFKRKPKLKVHAPDDGDDSVDSLDSEADRVLEKLHQQGEASLTSKERKVLEKYSRRVRKSRDT